MKYMDESIVYMEATRTNRQDFEDWLISKDILVGTSVVLEYLIKKKEFTTFIVPGNIDQRLRDRFILSPQAKVVVTKIPLFNVNEMFDWYATWFRVPPPLITDYFLDKGV